MVIPADKTHRGSGGNPQLVATRPSTAARPYGAKNRGLGPEGVLPPAGWCSAIGVSGVGEQVVLLRGTGDSSPVCAPQPEKGDWDKR